MNRPDQPKTQYALLLLLFSAFAFAVCLIGVSLMRQSPERTHTTDALPMTDLTAAPPTDTNAEPPVTSPPETEPPETDEPGVYRGVIRIDGDYVPSDGAAGALVDAISLFGHPTGLFAVDLETGTAIAVNADEAFEPASVIKVCYVLYCCRQIDANAASLDELLTYTEDDYIHGNGAIGKMGFGAQMTIREVITHVIKTSDNEGYYMLIRRFGREGYDEMMESLGCGTGRLAITRWPAISARDYASVWQEIYRYRSESDTGAMLFDLLLHVEYMHFFRDALDVSVANKSGWNDESYNEGGIVFGERTYALVIMSSCDYYTADTSRFGDIVRAVNAMMNEIGASAQS